MADPYVTAARSVSVAEAKGHLSELLTAVEPGETVQITTRGKPVATLARVQRPREPIDFDWLRSHRRHDHQDVSAREFIRQMRDDARY